MRWKDLYRMLRRRNLYFVATGLNPFYNRLISAKDVGSGNQHDYTDDQVRLLVAWLMVGQLTGRTNPAQGRRDAATLLAGTDHGWVAMSEGEASWHENVPTHLLAKGLVCLRVPDWQSILDTEQGFVYDDSRR